MLASIVALTAQKIQAGVAPWGIAGVAIESVRRAQF